MKIETKYLFVWIFTALDNITKIFTVALDIETHKWHVFTHNVCSHISFSCSRESNALLTLFFLSWRWSTDVWSTNKQTMTHFKYFTSQKISIFFVVVIHLIDSVSEYLMHLMFALVDVILSTANVELFHFAENKFQFSSRFLCETSPFIGHKSNSPFKTFVISCFTCQPWIIFRSSLDWYLLRPFLSSSSFLFTLSTPEVVTFYPLFCLNFSDLFSSLFSLFFFCCFHWVKLKRELVHLFTRCDNSIQSNSFQFSLTIFHLRFALSIH